MPIAVLPGNSKMPVYKPAGYDKMPVVGGPKKTMPLTEVTP